MIYYKIIEYIPVPESAARVVIQVRRVCRLIAVKLTLRLLYLHAELFNPGYVTDPWCFQASRSVNLLFGEHDVN